MTTTEREGTGLEQTGKRHHTHRIGIFFYYDGEDKVDRYVGDLLDAACVGIDRLLVVSNGPLDAQARELFRRYAAKGDILVRENRGFDVWAYKAGLDRLGWEEVGGYDELILFNHTIIPVVPSFAGVFEKMEARRELDFWGLTAHHGSPNKDPFHGPYGYLPVHIQSHFLAFRRSVTSAASFRRFWDELVPIESYEDSVSRFESYITKWLEDQGFRWDVYIDMSALVKYTPYPLFDLPVYAVRDHGAPVVKRKGFVMGNEHFLLSGNDPLVSRELLDYLRAEGRCDTEKIYDNIIRTAPQREIFESAGMMYPVSQNAGTPGRRPSAAVAIVVGRGWELELASFKELVSLYSVFVVAEREWIEAFGDRVPAEVVLTQSGTIRPSAPDLFTGAPFDYRDYEFVCVIDPHQKDAPDGTVEAQQIWNMGQLVLVREAVRLLLTTLRGGVIETMTEAPHVGLLTIPPRSQQLDRSELIHLWRTHRERILEHLGGVDPAAFTEKSVPMYIQSGVFWLRTCAVAGDAERMERFYEDLDDPRCFHLFLPLLIQKNGSLPGMVCDESILMSRYFEFGYEVRQMYELLGMKNEMDQIRQIYLCEKDELDQIRRIYLGEKDELDQIRRIYLDEKDELGQIRRIYLDEKDELDQIRRIYLGEKDELDQIRRIYLDEKDELDQIRRTYLGEKDELGQIRRIYLDEKDELDQIRRIYLDEKAGLEQLRYGCLGEREELDQIRQAYLRQMDALSAALQECRERTERSLTARAGRACKRIWARLKRWLGRADPTPAGADAGGTDHDGDPGKGA